MILEAADDVILDGQVLWSKGERRETDDPEEIAKLKSQGFVTAGTVEPGLRDIVDAGLQQAETEGAGSLFEDPTGEDSTPVHVLKSAGKGLVSSVAHGAAGVEKGIVGGVLDTVSAGARVLGNDKLADDLQRAKRFNDRMMDLKPLDDALLGEDPGRAAWDAMMGVSEGLGGIYGGIKAAVPLAAGLKAAKVAKTAEGAMKGAFTAQMAAGGEEAARTAILTKKDANGNPVADENGQPVIENRDLTWRERAEVGYHTLKEGITAQFFGRIAGAWGKKIGNAGAAALEFGGINAAGVLADAYIGDNIAGREWKDENGNILAGNEKDMAVLAKAGAAFAYGGMQSLLMSMGGGIAGRRSEGAEAGRGARPARPTEDLAAARQKAAAAMVQAATDPESMAVAARGANGETLMKNGALVRVAEDGATEIVTPDGVVLDAEGNVKTVAAGNVGETGEGSYGTAIAVRTNPLTGRPTAARETVRNALVALQEGVTIDQLREIDGWTPENKAVFETVARLKQGLADGMPSGELVDALASLGIGERDARAFGFIPEGNRYVGDALAVANNGTRSLQNAVGNGGPGHIPLDIAAEVARSVNAGTTGLMPKELAKRQLETARQIMAERAKAELEQGAAEHGNTPEAERAVLDTPVEKEDGTLTTLGEMTGGTGDGSPGTARPTQTDASPASPASPPGMRPAPSGEPGVYVHGAVPEARVEAGAEIDMPDGTRVKGVLIKGLDPAEMLRPERRDAVADFLIEVIDGAQGRVAFENPEAEAAARELLKERVAREETQSQRQAEQEIVDAGQNLVDGLFGKESGIKVRRGTPEEAMEAAEGAVGKNAAVELLKDAAGEIRGYWDRAKKEVVLFGGASVETLGHEIAWHAVRQWAETHSPELLAKMNEYAKRCPEELRKLIEEAYKDFSGDALLDEIGAGRFENELGGRFRELLGRSAEARTWWEGVKATLKEMWQAFVKMIDGGAIDLSRLDKMDADEGMRWLVDQMLQGRRLEGGGKGVRGAEPGDKRLQIVDVGGVKVPTVSDLKEAEKIRAKSPESVKGYVMQHLEDNITLLAGGTASITADTAHHYGWSPYNFATRTSGTLRKARARMATILSEILGQTKADGGTRENKPGKNGVGWRCRMPIGVPVLDNRKNVVDMVVYDADVIVKDQGHGKFLYDITRLKKNTVLTPGLANQRNALFGGGTQSAASGATALGKTPTPQSIPQSGGGAQAQIRPSIGGVKGASQMGIKGPGDAEAMEKAGKDREEIWRTTGWWRGKDGKWRVELPPLKMKGAKEIERALRDGGNETTLGKLIDAPDLFKAYPEMESLKIKFSPDVNVSAGAQYDNRSNIITVFNSGLETLANRPRRDQERYAEAQKRVLDEEYLKEVLKKYDALQIEHGTLEEEREAEKYIMSRIDARIADMNAAIMRRVAEDTGPFSPWSILVHEIEHAIQEREDFARGGSIDAIRHARSVVLEINHDIRAKMKEAGVQAWKDSKRERDWDAAQKELAGYKNDFELFRAFLEQADIPEEKRREYKTFLDGHERIWKGAMSRAYPGKDPQTVYESFAGEVEARNASRREAMSPEERAATPPWATEDVPEARQIIRFSRGQMSALAKSKVGGWVEGTSADGVRNAIEQKIEKGLPEGEYRFKQPGDRARLVKGAIKFYKRFAQKTVMLSDGRCVYFVPDARTRERGLTNDEAWAEYAIHAVTSSGQKLEGKEYSERVYNATKAQNMWRIENILKAERCKVQDEARDGRYGIEFYGKGVDGKVIRIITRPDESGNIYADLTEVTILGGRKKEELPPRKPLAEVVGAAQYRGGLLTGNAESIPQDGADGNGDLRLSRGYRPGDWRKTFTFGKAARGAAEQTNGGIAAGEERRRWEENPVDERIPEWDAPARNPNIAKPFALSSAEGVRLVKLLGGVMKKPKAYKDAIGVIDESDEQRIRDDLKAMGFFKGDDFLWAATATPAEVAADRADSQAALDARLEKLGEQRLKGEAGGGNRGLVRVSMSQVADLVLSLPAETGGNLGNVRTLAQGIVRGFERDRTPEQAAYYLQEAQSLIDWFYGRTAEPQNPQTTEQPNHQTTEPRARDVRKMIARAFGAFLEAPDAVAERAPGLYREFVDAISRNDKLLHAFDAIRRTALGEGSAERVYAEIEAGRTARAEEAARRLADEVEKPIGSRLERAKDSFVYNFDDMHGPIFMHITRAQKRQLAELKASLKAGRITQADYDAATAAFRTAVQGLKIAELKVDRGTQNEIRQYLWDMSFVFEQAKAAGVDPKDAQRYMDLRWIVSTGGRAGARGMSARDAQIVLDNMKRNMGDEAFARLEGVSAQFHAVREKNILDDPRLAAMIGQDRVHYFKNNVHYVRTERTRATPEELAQMEADRAAFRRENKGDDDVTAAMLSMLDKTGGRGGGIGNSTWGHALEGSVKDVKDRLAATWRNDTRLMAAMERNDFVLKMRDALLAAKAEGVHDLPGSRSVDYPQNARYGHIRYFENGKQRVLVVPRVLADGYRQVSDAMTGWSAWGKIAHGVFIDWNLAYTLRNMTRNMASNEANIVGMRADNATIVGNALLPGAGRAASMAAYQIARHLPSAVFRNPFTRAVFGGHVNAAYARQAQRILDLYLDPKKAVARQAAVEEARLRGDTAPAMELDADLELMRFMTKSGALIARWDEVQGAGRDADLFMRKSGLGEIYGEKGPSAPTGRVQKILAGAGKVLSYPFRRNAQFNRDLELHAKITAALAIHDMQPGLTAEQVGIEVARRASIPHAERRGANSKMINYAWNMFFNTALKGGQRFVGNVVRNPRLAGKMAAQSLGPQLFWATMIAGGGLAAVIRNMFGGGDDAEEKARQAGLGGLLDYAQFMHDGAFAASPYLQRFYHWCPLGQVGGRYIGIASPRTDEEKMLLPFIDWAAAKLAPEPTDPTAALGDAAKRSVVGTFVPDLTARTPLVAAAQDLVFAWWQNPMDTYRGTHVYDNRLWQARGESLADAAAFAGATLRQTFNDLGGRTIVRPRRNEIEVAEGSGAQPPSFAEKAWDIALNDIPVLSGVLGGSLRMTLTKEQRLDQVEREALAPIRAVKNLRAEELMKMMLAAPVANIGNETPEIKEQLDAWAKRYGWDENERGNVFARAFNGYQAATAEGQVLAEQKKQKSRRKRWAKLPESERKAMEAAGRREIEAE